MEELTEILRKATKSIGKEYFQLPVAGRECPIYRERVYCYELYHHMRSCWPEGTLYSLSGEVDKGGHRLIRGNNLDRTKPDFLVHIPGQMDYNELVMEVKPSVSDGRGIEKDLKTLTAYRRQANYRRAILLAYGGSQDSFERFREKVRSIVHEDRKEQIDLQLIELWWHGVCAEEADNVEW